MEVAKGERAARLEKIFASFDEFWMKYWESYVTLQNQLYETLRAAREVSWLAATDPRKLSEVNQVQRELFAGMPRRLDYMPLGQASTDLASAASKIAELEAALSLEEEDCKILEEAIETFKAKVKEMEKSLLALGT